MAAGKLNFVIEQGTTFSRALQLKNKDGNPIDLTGATLRGMIRSNFNSTSPTASFDFYINDALQGLATMSLSAVDTATILAGPSYVYDVEYEDAAGVVVRLMQGKIKISPEVTK